MLTGFWKLTWVEIKVFLREPMGVIATLVFPVLIFLFVGRGFGDPDASNAAEALPFNIAIMGALFIAIGAALSLIAIITIYREGGILKRLRATPLSPLTILGAHVFVKLIFTVVGMALLVLVGREFFAGASDVNLRSFTLALLLGTLSIISVGFVISSVIPTARFAQPLGSLLLYPMVALSGLFFPLDVLPTGWRAFANTLPTTHAVALMQGVWDVAVGGRIGSTCWDWWPSSRCAARYRPKRFAGNRAPSETRSRVLDRPCRRPAPADRSPRATWSL